MKYFLILIILISSTYSLKSQSEQTFEISYIAQTRGFKYLIEYKNKILKREINSSEENINLNHDQVNEITELLNEIDFNTLENNIDIERLAVDAAIKGNFRINFNEKIYELELDHNNLPDPILHLLKHLENF